MLRILFSLLSLLNCFKAMFARLRWFFRDLSRKTSYRWWRVRRFVSYFWRRLFPVKRERKRDDFEFFARLCRSVVGHSFLDSGSIYGYHHDRPLPEAEEPGLKFHIDPDGRYVEWSFSLARVLEQSLIATEPADAMQAQWEKYLEDHEDSYNSYLGDLEEFLEAIGAEDVRPDNSYNYDSDLDQVVWYCQFEREGEQYIAISPHCGCDVRGGYPKPQIYQFAEDDSCNFFCLLGNADLWCRDQNGCSAEYSSRYSWDDALRKAGQTGRVARVGYYGLELLCPDCGEYTLGFGYPYTELAEPLRYCPAIVLKYRAARKAVKAKIAAYRKRSRSVHLPRKPIWARLGALVSHLW